MRIKIKNADFSSVSIGKVEKDFSFAYVGSEKLKTTPWVNVINPAANLPWTSGGTNLSDITFLLASSSSSSYSTLTNNQRMLSDYIEVVEGMIITTNLKNTDTVPLIVCYDANKNALGPSSTYCLWKTSSAEYSSTFTIPAGVKYIRINVPGLYADDSDIPQFIKGE